MPMPDAKAKISSTLRVLSRYYRRHAMPLYAETTDRLIVRLSSSDHKALCRLGNAALERDNIQKAIDLFGRVALSRPDCVEASVGLARAYWLKGDRQRVHELLDAAVALSPHSLEIIMAMARLAREENRVRDAVAMYERGAVLYPRSHEPAIGLALVALDCGKREEAIRWCQKSVERAPNDLLAYGMLAKAGHYSSTEHPDVRHLESLLLKRCTRNERIVLHHVLGDVCDRAQEFGRAFRHYERANGLRPRWIGHRAQRRAVDVRMMVFTGEYVETKRSVRSCGENLIFVVGMPRSGTTLVEQVLASHPDVCAGGERTDIGEIVRSLRAQCGGQAKYPRYLWRVGDDALQAIAQSHLGKINQLSKGARWFVDKLPGNCEELGLIKMLFPGARLIHCRRHPLDTCLSCYCQGFDQISWAYRMADIGYYYRQYARLMSHWYAVLPGQIHDVFYEDMVSSTEVVCRRLFEYCGLSWNDGCLRFHNTARFVQTASMWQVKTPIYASSVGRWRCYSAHLGGLQRALGGMVAEYERPRG